MANRGVKSLRVTVKPELLRWARERAARSIATLGKAFPKIEAWESGKAQPTLKQLERLAKTLHVPLGFFFLDSPPEEQLPIPDFRTMPHIEFSRPSPELLDTIYLCQQRQEWYRNYLLSLGEEPLPFVGAVNLNDDANTVAADIRKRLKFDIEERRNIPTWRQALSRFIDQVETIGILAMVNGVVGNNTHRKLDPEEFRGFALVDEMAPLIFINGADTLSAKTFTLAHELAHIWLGESGITDSQIFRLPEDRVERWCNQVAAELLVPQKTLAQIYEPQNELPDELNRMARVFKVSTLVILRRIFEQGYLDWETYRQAYQDERERLLAYERPKPEESSGNFYRTLNRRVSKRFARAVIVSALEGQTLFRDAYRMLGISKSETFQKFAQELGVG